MNIIVQATNSELNNVNKQLTSTKDLAGKYLLSVEDQLHPYRQRLLLVLNDEVALAYNSRIA